LPSTLSLPIFKELIPEGVDYGSNLLVEFEPRSIWLETSLTLAAQALANGVPTKYHTFQRGPKEIRKELARLGVNVEKAQANDGFTVIDSHTIQTGIGVPETLERVVSQSVKLSDWSIGFVKLLKAEVAQNEMRWFHIDDNTGVLLEYNQEKDFIDLWRTRVIPYIRQCDSVLVYSIAKGVASDAFYKKIESLSDGIIDFKSEEENESAPGQFFRISSMRGRNVDSRWHRLQLRDNGEVAVAQ
jgi:KaiC/GvpD/RAD55 family RecA-like ATPase